MKRFFAFILSCLIALTCTVTTFAAPVIVEAAFVAFLDWVIDNVIDDLSDGAWSALKGSVKDAVFSADPVAYRSAVLSYWKGIIDHFDFTEAEFSDYYNKLVEDYTYIQSQAAAGIPVSSLDDPDYYYKVLDAYNLIYEGLNISSTESGMNLVDPNTIWNACQSSDVVSPDDNGNPRISSDDFKDFVDNDTTRTPKNTRNIMSWRNDPRYSEKGDSLSFPRLTWYNALSGGFIPLGGGNEIYMIPFYTDGEKMYFGNFQFHATVNNLKPQGTSYSFYTLDLEWLSFEVSLSEHNGSTRVSENSYYFAYDFSLPDSNSKGRFCVSPYDSIADFSSHSRHYDKYPSLNNDFLTLVCADDLGLTLDMSTVGGSHFGKSVAAHDESCDIGSGEDMGYFCSSTPIELDYHIDTQRIPDNYYITVEGDTVYDYTITNPDTGQSSTVNEYITNNYTYVTNEGGSSSGGSVGGNVTVGGQIDVSGSVDVGVDVNVSVPDININVNGGAGGTGALPDVDVVETLPAAPQGFLDYLAIFFDFLPPQVLVLLIGGIGAAIFCRVWGR